MSDLAALIAEHDRLLHAMQTGVKFTMEYKLNEDTTPKHLRVGINNALVSNGALVGLLIEKGVFTAEEWMTAYNTAMKREVEMYEHALSAHLKTKVVLG